LGAFLQTAAEWSWNTAALNVGNDTVQFARSRGFRVDRNVLEEASFSFQTFEAVFVWNCFEQIPDPARLLTAIHHVLRRNGLLVIRVPNSLFYSVMSRAFEEREYEPLAAHALAYNNLLGFPYLYGYTAESLNGLVSNHGFKPVFGANSELVTMPFADMTRRITREQTVISQAVSEWSEAAALASGKLAGPWIEMVFRKLEEPEWKAQPSSVRLSRRKINPRFLERAA
jgi:SAM-dependent methyltransferase